MANVTELVTEFGFKGSSQPLNKYNEALGGSIKLLAGAATATAAAVGASLAMITATNNETAAMVNLAESVGLSAQELQAYGSIAEGMGLQQDVVVDLVEEMNNKLGESFSLMKKGEAPLGAVSDSFGMIGLKMADLADLSPDEQFRKIAKALQEMPNQQEAASAADILFGGEANKFFSALDKQGKSLDGLIGQYEKINFLTDEGTDGAKKYTEATRNFGTIFSSMGRELSGIIGAQLTPDINEMTESISELIRENKDWIVNVVSKTVSVVMALGESLQRLAPVIAAIGVAFTISKISAIGFSTVMGTIASPVVLITAAIAGALLIIDDLIVAFKGGDSVIADFAQRFLGLDIQPILVNIVNGVKWMIGLVKDLIGGVIDIIVADFNRIVDSIKWVIDAGKSVAGFFSGLFSGDDKAMQESSSGIMAGSNIRNDAVNARGNTSNSINQTNSITINAANAQEAQEGVSNALQQQLTDSEQMLNRGGA